MELSNTLLLSGEFRKALTKLATCQDLDVKVAYNVMRFVKEVEKFVVISRNSWVELLRKYVPVGEDGNFVMENGEFKWLEGTMPEEAKSAIDAFGHAKHTIDRHPLDLDGLAPAKLSPADLSILEQILAPF
jgi:hypothetical protein